MNILRRRPRHHHRWFTVRVQHGVSEGWLGVGPLTWAAQRCLTCPAVQQAELGGHWSVAELNQQEELTRP